MHRYDWKGKQRRMYFLLCLMKYCALDIVRFNYHLCLRGQIHQAIPDVGGQCFQFGMELICLILGWKTQTCEALKIWRWKTLGKISSGSDFSSPFFPILPICTSKKKGFHKRPSFSWRPSENLQGVSWFFGFCCLMTSPLPGRHLLQYLDQNLPRKSCKPRSLLSS